MTSEKPETYSKRTRVICCALFLLGLPLWLTWSAYANLTLWRWFVEPLGAPSMSLAQAAGIALLIRALAPSGYKDERNGVELLAHAIVAPAFFLAAGWVIHLFMVPR